MDKQTALDLLDEKQDFLFSVSDSIWDHPETDYTETVSSGILMDALKKEGFTVTSGLAGIPTAFSGSYGSGSPGIEILGEIDALSGLSQKACATEKEALEPGGNGHGCGHNLLGAGSVAAAIAVKEYLEKNGKEGTVVFFGCPGEEGGSGKAFMAKGGAFSGLDAAITWHPGDLTRADTGSCL